MALCKKANRAGGHSHRVTVVRVSESSPGLLYRYVPAEQGCFARAKSAEDSWWHSVLVRKIHHRNKDLHRQTDRQSDPGARGSGAIRAQGKNTSDFARTQSRLTI